MKRFALPLLGAALLLAPTFASARLMGDLPKTTIGIEKPSRRTVREVARRNIWRNPALLTYGEVTLDGLYQNAEFTLQFNYPSTWERQDVNERDVTLTLPVMFLAPKQQGVDLRQNINLVIEKLDSAMTLRQYTELGIENEKEFFKDFSLISSEPVQLGNQRGYKVTFTASTDKTLMTFAQEWFVRGTQAYVWTFADDSRTFTKNIATFERMLDTLVIR